jgi:sugar phosphate isomerase/epimerase
VRLACQEQLIPGPDLLAKDDFIRSAGFDGIELRGAGGLGFARRLPELRAARKAGVELPTVCVMMDHFIGDFDPERRRDALVNMKSQLSVIAELGGYGAVTPAAYGMFSRRLPPFTPPRSPTQDRAVLLEALGELGRHAAAEGTWLLFEPLNRYEDHMVNTLDQAVELCQATGTGAVKVVADLFHMNIEEDDLAASIRRAAPYLGHVQLADSNRLQPGAGHLDWSAALAALAEVGYDGYLALECRLRGAPELVLPETAAFLRDRMPGRLAPALPAGGLR